MQKLKDTVQLNSGTVTKLASERKMVVNLRQAMKGCCRCLVQVFRPVQEMVEHHAEGATPQVLYRSGQQQ